MMEEEIKNLIEEAGGKVDESWVLPDGTGNMTASFPLPVDHWIYGEKDGFEPPPMVFRLGVNHPEHEKWVERIRSAGKYAVRASTLNGKDNDFDPDALLQNLIVGFLGYWTEDGITDLDEWANPNPIPEIKGGE